MKEQTQNYVSGRFRDFYRRTEFETPPKPKQREWGFVPWTESPGERFNRHKSILELGGLNEYLTHEGPKHVYFSSAYFEDPGTPTMEKKNWLGADLIFDLDADPEHMTVIDPETDTHKDMLEKCKPMLKNLLDFLENDFGFNDLTIVFSGNRGYHVHVRDESVQGLTGPNRGQLIKHVTGNGFRPELIVGDSEDGEIPDETETPYLISQYVGGWRARVHKQATKFINKANESEDPQSVLSELPNIGEKTADTILGIDNVTERIRSGGYAYSGHFALGKYIRAVAQHTLESQRAEIDESVTSDIHRLVRVPGTLHGGSALEVTRVPRDELDEFDPLTDAVPSQFKEHEIKVNVEDGGDYYLNGEVHELSAGEQSVPEYLGMYLMARGTAEKLRE